MCNVSPANWLAHLTNAESKKRILDLLASLFFSLISISRFLYLLLLQSPLKTLNQYCDFSCEIMALLDSKAQFSARAREIGLSTPCTNSLQAHGIDSLSSMAFAVGTTPGECSPQDFQQFILDKNITLEGSDEFLLKRLIFEAQTLFMTAIQSQVLSAGLPGGSDSTSKKLPPVERQARILEQKQRLVGVIIQGETEPSFELIDLAYAMIESKSIKFIPPHRCTKRDTELLENTNKDKEILTIEQGRLTSKKSSLPNTSTSDALKLSNCFLRRALALDLAQVTSFSQINKYHQLLLAQLSVKAPVGYTAAMGQTFGESWHRSIATDSGYFHSRDHGWPRIFSSSSSPT